MDTPSTLPPTAPTMTRITADEVAELLGISRDGVYAAANSGELPCRRLGRRFIFVREVIVDWALCRDSPRSR